jgi:hypothetical protein
VAFLLFISLMAWQIIKTGTFNFQTAGISGLVTLLLWKLEQLYWRHKK